MLYSNEPKDTIFVRSYFFSFAKHMVKNTSKNVSGKYSATSGTKVAHKLVDSAIKSGATKFATDGKNRLKRAIQKEKLKTAEVAGYLTGNEIPDVVAK